MEAEGNQKIINPPREYYISDKVLSDIKITKLYKENNTPYKAYVCPICFPVFGHRTDNVSQDRNEIVKHLKLNCQRLPARLQQMEDCHLQLNRLLKQPVIKLEPPRYMMASGFYHKFLSDPTSCVYQLALVDRETDEAYIGRFVQNVMINVVFPKETTRSLSNTEKKEYKEIITK